MTDPRLLQGLPPQRNQLWDWLSHAGDWQFPLGNTPMGPGGVTLNDLLVPLTDVRSETDRLLPETLSLNDIGRTLQYLSPQNITEEHLNAINTPADPNEPRSALRRLVGLFPAAGAEGGGALRQTARARPDGPPPGAGAVDLPRADIPTGVNAGHPMVGQIFTDQFAAMKVWKDAGGKQSGLKITPLPDKTWRIDAAPQAANPSPLPTAAGGNGVVGHGGGFAGPKPVSAESGVDRRGLYGPHPLRPGAAVVGADPEGRPLYADTLIAGQRQPGGPDVPLSMPEEVTLAEALGKLETPRGGIIGANGQVTVTQPGTLDPPTAPLMHMRVDADLPDDQYMRSFRHEGGHAIDYTSERTHRGGHRGQRQYTVPDDVRPELQAASAEMRAELWGPNAPQIYQRSDASLKEYRERPDELMADNYRYYKEDPAGYKAKYPAAAQYLRATVNDDPLLSRHVQFNVRGGPTNALIGALLDLSPEARAARALEMGFDPNRTLYHGTWKSDEAGDLSDAGGYTEFRPGHAGGTWLTENPEYAEAFGFGRGEIYPLKAPPDRDFLPVDEWEIEAPSEDTINRARNAGYKGLVGPKDTQNAGQYFVFEPRHLRSIHAAFDPAKADSANLLSAKAGGTNALLGALLDAPDESRLGRAPPIGRDDIDPAIAAVIAAYLGQAPLP
jgi:hypothetical protein